MLRGCLKRYFSTSSISLDQGRKVLRRNRMLKKTQEPRHHWTADGLRKVALIAVFLTCLLDFARADDGKSLEAQVQRVAPQVRADYEKIHKHPELGKKEFETSKLVRSRLEQMGYKQFLSVKGLPTAVITVLETGRPGPVVCLRAELDARPGNETTGLPYASMIPGVMHNCGHDAHTAMLLGAADILMK